MVGRDKQRVRRRKGMIGSASLLGETASHAFDSLGSSRASFQ